MDLFLRIDYRRIVVLSCDACVVATQDLIEWLLVIFVIFIILLLYLLYYIYYILLDLIEWLLLHARSNPFC
jgi:hypothetical protein